MQSNVRFSVYHHKFVLENKYLISRQFIVAKQNGLIVAFTEWHKYVLAYKHGLKKITDDGNNRFSFIVPFLNYVFFEKYNIKSLVDIETAMIKEYFCFYANGRLINDDVGIIPREKTTIEKCFRSILDFLEAVCEEYPQEVKYKINDLYTTKEKKTKSGKTKKIKVYNFDIAYLEKHHNVSYRIKDIPNSVMLKLISIVESQYPEILMVVILGAFAGLRTGDALSLNQDSIRFSFLGNQVHTCTIDLSYERPLRSDLKNDGRIKKEGKRVVAPIFVPYIYKYYKKYISNIDGKQVEKGYKPLTINSRGKAMLKKTYFNIFQKAAQQLKHLLITSDDPKKVWYGQLLTEHKITPHILRHYFSVQLVLNNYSNVEIMKYRGDKSLESVNVYIQNKGELMKKYSIIKDEIYNNIPIFGGEEHNND